MVYWVYHWRYKERDKIFNYDNGFIKYVSLLRGGFSIGPMEAQAPTWKNIYFLNKENLIKF